MTLGRAQDLHKAEALLIDIKAHKKEFLFQGDVASILAGHLSPARIEHEALQLLQDIKAHGSTDENYQEGPKPVFMFVAYDFGASLVKTVMK